MARTSFGAMFISFAAIGVAAATAMAIAGGDVGEAGSPRQTARGAAVTMQSEAEALPAARQARGMTGTAHAGADLPSGGYLSARLRAGEASLPR